MPHRLRVLLCSLLLIAAQAHAAPLSEKAFTEHVLTALVEAFDNTEFAYDGELRILARDAQGNESIVFLRNAFANHAADLYPLERIVQEQVEAFAGQLQGMASADARSIIPVIKPADYIATVQAQLKQAGREGDEFPFYMQRLNEDLYVFFVFDSPSSMRFVAPADVEKLGLAEESLLALARANLDAYYREYGASLSKLDTGGQGDLYLLSVDENYEASGLLSTRLWDKQNLPVAGDFVAFLPARNLMLVVGSEDAAGLELAARLARDAYMELGYAISPYGYVLSERGWIRYEP